MNLMFRKNFREGGGGGGGGGGKSGGSGGGSKLQTKGQRTKRSRELGGGSQGDEIHYRTHLLFAPARFGCDVSEERCSGFSSLPLSSMPRELDAPHPLVDRRPSLSLLRWNNYNSNVNDNDNYNYNYNYNSNNNTIYESNFNVTSTSPIDVVSSQGFNPLLEQITNESIITSPSPTTTTVAPDLTITGLLMNSNYAAGRQATVGDGNAVAGSGALPSACLTRAEPISLAALDRDCFIIPVHNVERFLPAGIPMPPPPITAPTAKASSPLSVLEVSDPKMCILVHLMSPLEPIDPMLESPLAHPLLKQRSVASELLSEVQQANQAVGGMLLANMEKSSEFPFISYYAINTTQTDPSTFYSGIRVSSLSKFEPKNLKYTAAHTLDLYSEVAAICRPPLVLAPSEVGGFKKTQTPATGYIISVFKVFEGDDGERFEKNWLYWTGARMLYRYLPRTAGLRRIALHKSTSTKGDKMYLLVCECADLLKDITAAAFLIPALRARLCGYTGLYRPIQAF